MENVYKEKYLKYKKKYLEIKNQLGGRLGELFDYSSDEKIKQIFITNNDNRLHIYWTLENKIITSRIKTYTEINNKFICITESGTVYITKKPIYYDIAPVITENMFR
jgi:hypothetical protein